MSAGVKDRLLNRLAGTHSAVQETIEGADLEMRVYTDTDWSIRDILGHIATWDREVTKSLRAYLEGGEYIIPDLGEDETDFNQRAVMEQRELSNEQLLAEWVQARDEFRAAIGAIPLERYPGDLAYPWGERGDITKLVDYMLEHDVEHRDEIAAAIQASAEK